jgi:hypothetical protein
MAIVGFGFDKISAEKKSEKLPKEAKIESNINISNVEGDEMNVGKNQPLLKIGFKFSIDYQPDYALLEVNGHVLNMLDEKEHKEVLAKWDKDKKLDKDILTTVLNFILAKVHIKSLELSQDLNLPPHLPLPHVQTKPEEKEDPKQSEYIG